MNKNDVIKCFGGTVKLSKLLGISSQAVSMWPDEITSRRYNEIIGAATRAGMSQIVTKMISASPGAPSEAA